MIYLVLKTSKIKFSPIFLIKISQSETLIQSLNNIEDGLRTFFKSFNPIDNVSYYQYKLNELTQQTKTNTVTLPIKLSEIRQFPLLTPYFTQIEQNMPIILHILTKIIYQQNPDLLQAKIVVIPTFTTKELTPTSLADMDATKLHNIQQLQGTIIRTNGIRNKLFHFTKTCELCNNQTEQFYWENNNWCEKCGNYTQQILDPEKNIYFSEQEVKIQEDSATGVQSINVKLYGDLINKLKPGDHVIFTGYFNQEQIQTKVIRQSALIKEILDNFALNDQLVQVITKDRLINQDNIQEIKTDKVNEQLIFDLNFVSLDCEIQQAKLNQENSSHISHYDLDKLIQSFCPQISGLTTVKLAILLSLVSVEPEQSVNVAQMVEKQHSARHSIHTLIVGNPSTGKTTLLSYAASLLPHSTYNNATTASIAGLTASIINENGRQQIVAGSLLVSNNGLCSIDEFTSVQQSDMSALHELMEQQSLSVSKAGINAKIRSNCVILAACRPRGRQYDWSKTLRENVNITSAIMSRFDIVCIISDQEQNIAERMLKDIKPAYSREEITQFLIQAQNCHPILTVTAQEAIQQEYIKMRQGILNISVQTAYKITVRQLESLIRLSTAFAKLELSDIVEQRHVQQAVQLMSRLNVQLQSKRYEISVSQGSDEEENRTDDINEISDQNQQKHQFTVTDEQLTTISITLHWQIQNDQCTTFDLKAFIATCRLFLNFEGFSDEEVEQICYKILHDKLIVEKMFVNICGDDLYSFTPRVGI